MFKPVNFTFFFFIASLNFPSFAMAPELSEANIKQSLTGEIEPYYTIVIEYAPGKRSIEISQKAKVLKKSEFFRALIAHPRPNKSIEDNSVNLGTIVIKDPRIENIQEFDSLLWMNYLLIQTKALSEELKARVFHLFIINKPLQEFPRLISLSNQYQLEALYDSLNNYFTLLSSLA